ncbi:MAG: TlpA disulfide reductase family protein [Ekhidna sp.]
MKIMLLFLGLFPFLVFSQTMKPGTWGGEIHYADISVPFTFEVGYPNGEIPEIVFINGKERRVVKNATVEGDSITIPMDPFDVAIKARFSAMGMSGSYIKYYRDVKLPFSASFGKPRFMKKSTKISPSQLASKWSMTLDPETKNASQGVGLFNLSNGVVTGTILTGVSDYRFFEGILDGDSIKLSSFDGAHAFMILGKKIGQKWEGKMIYDINYAEPWIAEPNPNAALPDPFEIVTLEQGVHKPYYDLLSAGSGKNAINAEEYAGKVLVIQLFGTWCPNSHDETQYLVKWYAKNKDRDIAILASSYEANYSQEYGLKRLDDYKEMNNIPYDLVLGGRLSKTSAAMPFPFMNKIEAFPTLVIIDKQGYARYVHSYFNGPATGSYYTDFDQRFNDIIDQLLEE